MKSYNPFKMWGSGLGAIVSLALEILREQLILGGKSFPIAEYLFYPISRFFNIIVAVQSANSYDYFLAALLVLSYGFLLGWAIHSIFRYFKKR